MLIVNAHILTMEERDIKNGYIEISNGKILEIGDMEEIKRGSGEIYDAGGRIVLPGFVEGHAHLGIWENAVGFEGDDGNEESDPVTPHIRGLDAVNPMDYCFEEARKAGVTTVVVGPGSANPIGGAFLAMKTIGKRIDDMLVKSPAGIKFALGENPKTIYNGKNQMPVTRMAIASLIRENLEKARRYMYDKEKAEENAEYEEPEYDIKYESLIPVLRKDIKAFFHAHRADDIFTAMRIGREFDLDYVIIHCTEGHKIAEILAKENVGIITGPFISDRSKPELAALTPKNPSVLNSNGIKAAICTDHPEVPVQYLLLSAMIAHKEGLPREEALKAITIYPAAICGIEDEVGSIREGKAADLVFFDEDPMSVYTKPVKVMINGDWVD